MNSILISAAQTPDLLVRSMPAAYGAPQGAPVGVGRARGLRVAPLSMPAPRVECVLGVHALAPMMSLPQVESVFSTVDVQVQHLVNGRQDFIGAPVADVKRVDGSTGVPPRGRPV